jgi:hypothetical protein
LYLGSEPSGVNTAFTTVGTLLEDLLTGEGQPTGRIPDLDEASSHVLRPGDEEARRRQLGAPLDEVRREA